MLRLLAVSSITLLLLLSADAIVHQYTGTSGPDKSTATNNTKTLNAAFLSLQSGDTLVIPNNSYWLTGGVFASNLLDVTVVLDGTLRFLPGRAGWPTEPCPHDPSKECVVKAMLFADVHKFTLTSSNVHQGGGIIDGGGEPWWGYANYLLHGEDRPKLFTVQNGTSIVVEGWHLRQVSRLFYYSYVMQFNNVSRTLRSLVGIVLSSARSLIASFFSFDFLYILPSII